MKLGNFVRSAYLKVLDLILPQKAISGFCADTAQHFTHLLHTDHIRVFLKKQPIRFIGSQQSISTFLLKIEMQAAGARP